MSAKYLTADELQALLERLARENLELKLAISPLISFILGQLIGGGVVNRDEQLEFLQGMAEEAGDALTKATGIAQPSNPIIDSVISGLQVERARSNPRSLRLVQPDDEGPDAA